MGGLKTRFLLIVKLSAETMYSLIRKTLKLFFKYTIQ